jgi:hypothetical protein
MARNHRYRLAIKERTDFAKKLPPSNRYVVTIPVDVKGTSRRATVHSQNDAEFLERLGRTLENFRRTSAQTSALFFEGIARTLDPLVRTPPENSAQFYTRLNGYVEALRSISTLRATSNHLKSTPNIMESS